MSLPLTGKLVSSVPCLYLQTGNCGVRSRSDHFTRSTFPVLNVFEPRKNAVRRGHPGRGQIYVGCSGGKSQISQGIETSLAREVDLLQISPLKLPFTLRFPVLCASVREKVVARFNSSDLTLPYARGTRKLVHPKTARSKNLRISIFGMQW